MNGTTGRTNDARVTTNGGTAARRRMADPNGDDYRRTRAAWERFAAGEDAVRGVRPEILVSWYRCREEYKVDPHLTRAPPAPERCEHSLEHDAVFAELGGLAAGAGAEVDTLDGLITVADCDGRILACWGNQDTIDRAQESNLAPWSTWSEWTTGTNGMGTALESHGPVFVHGPEHWCQGFHDWACAGLAVRDVVTDEPLAVLNVSLQRTELPEATADWLRKAASTVQARLRRRERHSGTDLIAAFTDAASRTSAPVAALDTAGKVVIANEEAGLLLGAPADMPAADPASRWTCQVPEFGSLATRAAECARHDHQWIGSTQIVAPFTGTPLPVTVRPVLKAGRVIGLLITGGRQDGEPLQPASPQPRQSRPLPGRVIGRRGARLILLGLHEIRFAEADGNTIWITADQGRMQATTQGLDNLEQQLKAEGFLRVHRRFLVNLRRVREVEQGFKGALFLVTDVRTHEKVPVSRRHAAVLRRVLGV